MKKNGFSDSFCAKWENFFEKSKTDGADDGQMIASMAAALKEETGLSSRTSKEIVTARAKHVHHHYTTVRTEYQSRILLKGLRHLGD